MKRGRREPELDIIWTPVGSLCFFVCLHLQFQNNNNYMNMAEANGALLAAGDVSMLYFFFLFCFVTYLNSLLRKWKFNRMQTYSLIQMQASTVGKIVLLVPSFE